jgi:hypothetical protein
MSLSSFSDQLIDAFNTDFRNDEVLSVTFTMEPDGTSGYFEYTAICGSQSANEVLCDASIRDIRNQIDTYNKTAFQPIEVITEVLS